MTDNEILKRLTSIFGNVFDYTGEPLTLATTSEDVDGWDSMSNITLALEIERQFYIKIKIAEMESLKNIRELVALIKSRLKLTTH
ncbi:MAG: acyl carrier protein [Rhodospirillales bacterium]|nr:acyl carrier protein [Rhodospirillales bacterium]MDE2318288.1 acyl carrier protein [Rhodospirillales bacterium]